MKKALLISLSVLLALSPFALFFGCSEDARSTSDAAASLETTLSLLQASHAAAEEKAAYYQSLSEQLEAELLSVKADFFTACVEYEARIEELEAAVSDLGADAVSPFRFSVVDGKATLTEYLGHESVVVIPSQTPDGLPVVAIGERAFENNAELTAVTVPEGVTSMGWFAFSGCVSLGHATLPASVSEIGYGAFLNCPANLSITAPSGSYAEAYALSYGLSVG